MSLTKSAQVPLHHAHLPPSPTPRPLWRYCACPKVSRLADLDVHVSSWRSRSEVPGSLRSLASADGGDHVVDCPRLTNPWGRGAGLDRQDCRPIASGASVPPLSNPPTQPEKGATRAARTMPFTVEARKSASWALEVEC